MLDNKKDPFLPPFTVQYTTFPGSGSVLWPVVKVRLVSKTFSIPQPILALVDSGASNSILHPFIAETLGFDLKKLGNPQIGTGVGGSHRSWILPESIELNIASQTFTKTFHVIDNDRLLWPCILGEDSMFSFARIDFYKFKNYFELRFRKDIN